jgi:hypothetical protein
MLEYGIYGAVIATIAFIFVKVILPKQLHHHN